MSDLPQPTLSAPASSVPTYIVMPYREELDQLAATYEAAMAADVGALAAWLRDHGGRPLLLIGAGGSLAIAEMGAVLFQRATGGMAKSGEPMDLYALDEHSSDQRVLLVTASGGHSDSLFACARLPRLPLASAVFCGALESPGEQMLAGTAVDVYAYDLLPDVHGWVAVNVLLAQAVVLARAFDTAFPGTVGALPTDLASLLPDRAGVGPSLDGYEDGLRAVLQQPVLAFLHGHESRSAQRDLDSKFAESGLGELASSEYRNFAHGRYQAILPREEAFGVLGFATAAELPIARASFALLPDDLPHALIELAGESAAAQQVSGLIGVLFVVGALERVRGISVGWGSRETFGDALYELDLGEIVPPLPET